MRFIDTLYFVCSQFYKKRESDSFKVSGLILLIGVFTLNTLLLTYLFVNSRFVSINMKDIYLNRHCLVFVFMALFGMLTHIRYFRITNFEEIRDWLYSIHEVKRNLYYSLALIYVILSFISFLSYVFYKGGAVKGWW
jgi:hypothetical protein